MKLFLNTRRSGYGYEQCGTTMTVGELIELLNQYNEDTEVFFKNDNGYTYGSIYEDDFEESNEDEVDEDEVAMEEFAVEINNEKGFVKQIDVFKTLEEADKFMKEYDELLEEDEYLNIICIETNKYGDEIRFYSVF